MNVIIIEDEKPAADKLQKALQKMGRDIRVLASLASVAESLQWLEQNPVPDLIFMDIELTDGLSFRIFEKTEIQSPVIFVTAFDEYWQEAFECNSIDYLLKPLSQEKLEAAVQKYFSLKNFFSRNYADLLQWQGRQESGVNRKRFLVKKGSDYISIPTEEIAYFYAIHKLICLVTKSGDKHILDQSLSEVEKSIDPSQFYRVNRKYLVNMNAIKRIRSVSKSKLLLEIDPAVNEDVMISQENTGAFKEWLGGT